MANFIKRFETISRHEVGLRQSPAVISCLVNVLNYIKSVLDDDSTQTLFEMIGHHLDTQDETAHYLNIELLSEQVLKALQYAFVSIGVYTNDRATKEQTIDFFRDIYDGTGSHVGVKILTLSSRYSDSGSVPMNYNDFTMWLVSNPDIYTDDIPVDYDAFRMGLTLRLAREWFKVNHDTIIDAHAQSVMGKLTKLMAVSDVSPSYWFTPSTFDNAMYSLLDKSDYDRLMNLVSSRLNILGGNQNIIDYTTHPDVVTLPLLVGYDESTMLMTTFFTEMYDGSVGEVGVRILQLNDDSIRALYFGGNMTFGGYVELLSDCGETDVNLISRKYLNYYEDHLNFVLSSSMTPEYQATLTEIRGTVNLNYNKVFHVCTILNKNNFGISVGLNINHLTPIRTLDLINVVGLSKSVMCLSLVPYYDVYGTLFNRLVVSFDNYNPAFTGVLIEKISIGEHKDLNIVLTMGRDSMSAHMAIGEEKIVIKFPNIDRMYNVDPFFLFVGPRLAEYRKGTTRLSSLKLYGQALTDDDAMAIIAGFRHM